MSLPSKIRGPGGEFEWRRLLAILASHWDEQPRVEIIGLWRDGDDVVVRWRASRATQHVVVHIQHDGGGGGGETYDAGTSVSRTRVDARENRQQDSTIVRSTDDHYTVWLIPSVLEPDGTFTDYDGTEGADVMAVQAVGSRLD